MQRYFRDGRLWSVLPLTNEWCGTASAKRSSAAAVVLIPGDPPELGGCSYAAVSRRDESFVDPTLKTQRLPDIPSASEPQSRGECPIRRPTHQVKVRG